MIKLLIYILLITNLFASGAQANILNKKSLEEVGKLYKDNIDKMKDDQLIFIPKNTLACNTRQQYKKAYNYVINNSGSASKAALRNMGCSAMSSWSIGLVCDVKEGSDIIQLAYKMPFSDDHITVDFFSRGSIMTVEQRKKMQIK